MIVVAACDRNYGIGYRGALPWPTLSVDLYHLRGLSSECAVIMGRETYERIPRPMLHDTTPIMVTSTYFKHARTLTAPSFGAAVKLAAATHTADDTVVWGGASIFDEALQHPDTTHLYLTRVAAEYEADRYFPSHHLNTGWTLVRNDITVAATQIAPAYTFETWKRA